MKKPRHLLCIGMGSVGKGVISLLSHQLPLFQLNQITVLDKLNQIDFLSSMISAGLRFEQIELTESNYQEIIKRYVQYGDIVLDLSSNIDTIDMVQFCQTNHFLYLNTAMEGWGTRSSNASLFDRQLQLGKIKALAYKTTALLDHGMNPGLISQFTKQSLLDVAIEKILNQKKFSQLWKSIEISIETEDFAKLAHLLQVKTILIAERDSQQVFKETNPGVFYNTWSVPGIIDEMMAPAEIAWGSHETSLPKNAKLFNFNSAKHVVLPTIGLSTYVRSCVPSGEYIGLCVPHGETLTLSNYLCHTNDTGASDNPSIYFSYLPCELALNALFQIQQGKKLPQQKILTTEIEKGADEVGCLLLSPLFNNWWTGSVLTIEDARKVLPRLNATTLQVAIGVLSGLSWINTHDNRGICFPEELPVQQILHFAKPYLGQYYSGTLPETFSASSHYQFQDLSRDYNTFIHQSYFLTKTSTRLMSDLRDSKQDLVHLKRASFEPSTTQNKPRPPFSPSK